MRLIYTRIKAFFLRFFATRTPEPKELKLTRKRTIKEKEHFGAHYYLGDLLDNLEDAISVMKEMRRSDPDMYAYLSRVGVPTSSDQNKFYEAQDENLRAGSRPNIAAHHFGGKQQDDNRLHLRFVTIQKKYFVPGVQFTNASMYECTQYFWDNKVKKLIPASYYVNIDEDGNMSILRERVTRYKGKRRDIPTETWSFPWYLKKYAEDNGQEPVKHGLFIFNMTYNLWRGSHNGLQIRAEKDAVAAAFAIDMLRTPYFFKDREKAVNQNGRTKRIFHIVRTHKRKTGKVIKSHFRGLRSFDWNGFKVNIILPNRSLFGFNVTSYELGASGSPKIEESVDAEKVGNKLKEYLVQ